MKYIILAFFVFLASMPVQASCESMHASGEAPSGQQPIDDDMNHPGMDHSGMDHSGVDHSGMNHSGMDHSGMKAAMDCCDHDPAGPSGNCDSMSTCRAPVFNYVLIEPIPLNETGIDRQQPTSTDTSAPISQFIAPPLRPPIT